MLHTQSTVQVSVLIIVMEQFESRLVCGTINTENE